MYEYFCPQCFRRSSFERDQVLVQCSCGTEMIPTYGKKVFGGGEDARERI